MKVNVLPGLTGLDEAVWNGLLERSAAPSVFLTWQWQTEWARAFVPDRSLHILTLTGADGSLVGLLPLYEDSPERLRLLGGVDVSDYLDAIAPAGSEDEVWQSLLAAPGRPARRVGSPRRARGVADGRDPAAARAVLGAASARRWSRSTAPS